MRCSVIILNWNGAAMLRQYLPSVIAYTQTEGVETVVADNGSTDDSIEVLERDFPTVRTIKLDRNYGFAAGYNLALDQTDSRYTVLLNSDVEVTEGWLDSLLDYMDTHPQTAACQPKILSYRHKESFEYAGAAGGKIDRLGYPFCRGRVLGHIEKDNGQYATDDNLFWASGACLCVRTDLYKTIGGLDADFFAHMEEIDLCWRMLCGGWKIAAVTSSTVYHLGGGSLSYESPRKTFLNFRNNLLMLYKNLPDDKLRSVMRWRMLLDYAAALHLLLAGRFQNAKAVFDARSEYKKLTKQSSWQNKRQNNIKRAIVPYPGTIADRSILWDYYFRRMRK